MEKEDIDVDNERAAEVVVVVVVFVREHVRGFGEAVPEAERSR